MDASHAHAYWERVLRAEEVDHAFTSYSTEATMRAWLAAGGRYLLGANDTRCAAPELLGFGDDTLVLLPRAFAES